MKIINLLLIMLILCGVASAELRIGAGYFNFDYKEIIETPPGQPKQKSTEKASLPYTELAYFSPQTEKRYGYLFRCRFAQGESIFEGTDWNGKAVLDQTSNVFYSMESRIEYVLPAAHEISMVLYSGFDYNYWLRRLRGGTPYNETYFSYYLPLGMRLTDNNNRASGFSVSIDISYLIMLGGMIYVDSINDNMDLGRSNGWKLAAPIVMDLDSGAKISFIPWFKQTSFLKSNEVTVYRFYEPASNTTQYGVQVQLAF